MRARMPGCREGEHRKPCTMFNINKRAPERRPEMGAASGL